MIRCSGESRSAWVQEKAGVLEIEMNAVSGNPWWTLPENFDVPLLFFMKGHLVVIETFTFYTLTATPSFSRIGSSQPQFRLRSLWLDHTMQREWLKDMILNLHSQVAYHQAWDVASGSRTKPSPAMTDASVRSFCWGLSPANRMKWTTWSALGRWGGIFASCLGAPSCFSRTWVWGKSPKQKMVLNVMTNFQ